MPPFSFFGSSLLNLEEEEKRSVFLGGREMLTEDFLFLVISVAQVTQLGIGRDVWTLTPENIEKALKVSE